MNIKEEIKKEIALVKLKKESLMHKLLEDQANGNKGKSLEQWKREGDINDLNVFTIAILKDFLKIEPEEWDEYFGNADFCYCEGLNEIARDYLKHFKELMGV